MIEFSSPIWLWGLVLVPLVAFALAWGDRRARSETARFTGERLEDVLAPGRSWRKNLLKGALRTLAYALVVVALAGPRFGKSLVKVEREGIDIVIALDTSLSMLAEDMLPSRLERARHEIIDLIRGLKGDRVGLVVFAGAAYPICPLTVDYDAALMFAQSIDVYAVSEPGTAIDKAIDAGVALFDDENRRDRAVILVTDGENHEGDPHGAAEAAAAKKVRVYTIGIGNPSGELIPERGADGSVAGYKKDRHGETVLTRLDEETLIDVAKTTGARYLPATREGLELDVLYGEISGMDRKTIKGEFVERRKERFWMFLAAALALLMIDSLVGPRATGAGRSRRVLHTGVMALACLFALTAAPRPASAKSVNASRVKEGNARYNEGQYGDALRLYRDALGDTLHLPKHYQGVLYNEGNALYMQKDYKAAIDRYQRSFSEDSTLTGRMLYNRGNAMAQGGMLKEAVESYVQALQYLPDDEQARHNLEMALRMLEEQKKQEQEQQKGGDENKDKDQEGDEEQQQQQQGDQQNQDGQQQQNRENQQQDEEQQEGEPRDSTSNQQQQPDSMDVEPPQADSTAVPPPNLSPEDMQKLSREDAMRILRALEEQEKQIQEQRRKAAFRRLKRSGKDW